MKDLKIQFSHQIKGRIQIRKNKTAHNVKTFSFASEKDFSVNINLNGLKEGDYTASLEWVHNNNLYAIEKHLTIFNKEGNFLMVN